MGGPESGLDHLALQQHMVTMLLLIICSLLVPYFDHIAIIFESQFFVTELFGGEAATAAVLAAAIHDEQAAT